MTAWKEIHNADYIVFHDDSIECLNDGIKKFYEYQNPQGEFFNLKTVIEDAVKDGSEAKEIIGFNPKYLTTLSKIFAHCGGTQLVFSFSKGSKGAFVYPYNESGMFALLMPIIIEEPVRYVINN
jgi:hypothetical protein